MANSSRLLLVVVVVVVAIVAHGSPQRVSVHYRLGAFSTENTSRESSTAKQMQDNNNTTKWSNRNSRRPSRKCRPLYGSRLFLLSVCVTIPFNNRPVGWLGPPPVKLVSCVDAQSGGCLSLVFSFFFFNEPPCVLLVCVPHLKMSCSSGRPPRTHTRPLTLQY